VPKHQAVERDIAVVVAEAVAHDALMRTIRAAADPALLRDAVLFDIYRPPVDRDAPVGPGGLARGEKSMAVRLRFNSDGATLTDEQVEAAVAAILEQLSARLGAHLRV
jgi:phenylalanyl-tRNA synthetase beta chain